MKQLLPAVAIAASMLVAGAAQAAEFLTVTGETSGGPTFQRAVEDFSALSGVGTDVAYRTFTFTVAASGEYSFLTTSAFDAVTFLYGPSFTPASPLANGLAGNDDLASTNTSGFAHTLVAGATYVHLVTGFDNSEVGRYTSTIGGPGVISAVPELPTWLLAMAGISAIVATRRRGTAG